MLCWDHGTKEKPGSDAGSRPRIAAGPADSRVFASLRRSAAAVFQHTCGVLGDTAALFAIQQVLFRTGKGGAAMGIVYQEGPSLARDLGLPLRTLYAVSNRIPAHYHRAEVPKRDGGVRVLRVPDPVLKDIQRRIARVLLSGMSVSPHATAYRYGAGVVENTRPVCGPPRAAGAGGLLAPGPAGQPGGGGVPPLAAGRDAGMGVKRGGHMGNGVLLTAAM